MLTGDEIQDQELIIDGIPTGYRASSYDVRIDQIIADGGAPCERLKMPPQGIVQVISCERVKLPATISGLAMVKTSLCNDGLLALNIGIIDPGYEGRISSFLVNFSNVPRVLMQGETFLRLQFVPLPNGTSTRDPIDDDTYIRDRSRQSAQFGTTFLNLAEVIETATNEMFAKWRTRIIAYAGTAALALAVFTFLLNFASFAMVKGWLQPTDTVRADIYHNMLIDQTATLLKANSDLQARVRALEARLPAPAPASAPSPPPASPHQ